MKTITLELINWKNGRMNEIFQTGNENFWKQFSLDSQMNFWFLDSILFANNVMWN